MRKKRKLNVEVSHCLKCPFAVIQKAQMGHPYTCTYQGNRTYILDSTIDLMDPADHVAFFKVKFENKDFPGFCPLPE